MNFHHFLNLTTLHENKLLKFLQYGICPGTQDLGLVDRKSHPLHNRDRHQFFAILTVSQCVNVIKRTSHNMLRILIIIKVRNYRKIKKMQNVITVISTFCCMQSVSYLCSLS